MTSCTHIRTLFLALTSAVAFPSPAVAQPRPLELEIEAGPAWQSDNSVEIPNDGSATRFSLSDLAGSGPWSAARVYVTWRPAERHAVRLLIAPLSTAAVGTPATTLDFAGARYVEGTPVQAAYTFNSYRLSYRWRLHAAERTSAWLGVTAKVRDASIALAQGSTASRKDDLGFVPLLHASGDWRPAPRWRLAFDADALAGGPGRAVDASLKLGYDLDRTWSVRAGYRTVEGGADVESVYNFAWLHYAVVAVAWRPGVAPW